MAAKKASKKASSKSSRMLATKADIIRRYHKSRTTVDRWATHKHFPSLPCRVGTMDRFVEIYKTPKPPICRSDDVDAITAAMTEEEIEKLSPTAQFRYWKSKREHMRYLVETGVLVDRESAIRALASFFTDARLQLESMVARVEQLLPDDDHKPIVLQEIQSIVHDALRTLAKAKDSPVLQDKRPKTEKADDDQKRDSN